MIIGGWEHRCAGEAFTSILQLERVDLYFLFIRQSVAVPIAVVSASLRISLDTALIRVPVS